MLMIGDLFLGMLTGYLRSPLSFSLCLMGRSADHQPNARSAQTGEADKLMGCAADHDPTGWDALRTMHHVDPLDLILLLISVPRVETRGYKMGSIRWIVTGVGLGCVFVFG